MCMIYLNHIHPITYFHLCHSGMFPLPSTPFSVFMSFFCDPLSSVRIAYINILMCYLPEHGQLISGHTTEKKWLSHAVSYVLIEPCAVVGPHKHLPIHNRM